MSQAAVATAVPVFASSARANALAERLERGAEALAILAASLTDAEWKTPSRTTAAPSASSCITSARCIRWRSSWRRCSRRASRSSA